MSRLVLVIALLLLVALVYRSIRKHKRSTGPGKKQITTRNMTKCDYCGLHVPEQEVIKYKGRNYCTEEHKLLDHPRD